MKTTPLTQRDLELLDAPSIQAQLPVVFDCGSGVDVFNGDCQGCQQTIEPGLLRGHVVHHPPHMVAIEAVGLCRQCKLVTRFVYRIYDDGRITGPRENGWQTWRFRRPGLWQRLLRLFR